MNIPITPTDHALGDFVFRAADRMRIDGCTNALAREGLSLALHCEHEALLDHYLGLLLTRLRQQAPEHSIEVYFPTNTDSLLGRFNDALAQQSLAEATRTPEVAKRAQIWIVHDAHALPDAEIQLLARLIQNFPGANIRAVLLMSGQHGAHQKLSAFGRKILRWDIEAPNPEQSQAALDQANLDGRFLPVQQLLQRIQRPTWSAQSQLNHPEPAEEATPDAAPELAKVNKARQHLDTFHAKGLAALGQSRHQFMRLRHLPLKAVMGVGSALALSTLIMLWLQPEAFGIAKSLRSAPVATPQASAPASSSSVPQAPNMLAPQSTAAQVNASTPLPSTVPTSAPR
jgi:hypothetical protein